MSAIGFPSLNQVSVIGRIAQEPAFGNSGRVRTVTLGVETEDEGGSRVHRITIQDEFLVRAMHDRLVVGAMVHVLGELDYDDNGCFVAVTQRRGSDVHVLGDSEPETASRPLSASAPRVAPSVAVQPPRPPAPVQAARPAPVQTPAAASIPAKSIGPEPVDAQAEVDDDPETAEPPPPAPAPVVAPVTLAPRRPLPATSPAFPVPRAVPPTPPRPAVPAGGGVLGALKSSAPGPATDDAPFPGDVPSRPNGGLGGLRPPPPAGGVRKPTGPDSFDDDIPF